MNIKKQLKNDVKTFLDNGGKVTKCKAGATGLSYIDNQVQSLRDALVSIADTNGINDLINRVDTFTE